MKKTIVHIILLFFFLPNLTGQTIYTITVDGSINPAVAEFIHRSIEKAKAKNAECLIINLNTPGGLLKSTRVIVGDILESTVPVVVYVSPAGAHAGSAGVFITLAAHVAAMAPGTNIGAAHPVSLQGGVDTIMNEKATNDAAAFIRTIAQKRNRNLEWAENAVRKSVSLTAYEAREKNVIDIVAVTEKELLKAMDGKIVEVNQDSVTLSTKGMKTEPINMGFMEKILNILSDPNIAYILMMLG